MERISRYDTQTQVLSEDERRQLRAARFAGAAQPPVFGAQRKRVHAAVDEEQQEEPVSRGEEEQDGATRASKVT